MPPIVVHEDRHLFFQDTMAKSSRLTPCHCFRRNENAYTSITELEQKNYLS